MAANKPSHPGLLLNDDDDAPVPLGGTASLPAVEPVTLRTPTGGLNDQLGSLMEPAIEWATSPFPAFGVRALIFAVTGVSFGMSRRERDLRLVFCAMYRAAYDQPNPKGD